MNIHENIKDGGGNMMKFKAGKTNVFVLHPKEEKPDPREHQYSWLYMPLKKEDSNKWIIMGFYADDKVSGGGHYPILWRKNESLEVPQDLFNTDSLRKGHMYYVYSRIINEFSDFMITDVTITDNEEIYEW